MPKIDRVIYFGQNLFIGYEPIHYWFESFQARHEFQDLSKELKHNLKIKLKIEFLRISSCKCPKLQALRGHL